MLRLPAALIEDISLRAGQLSSLSQTCTAFWRVLDQPETQLRFYLAARRRHCLPSSNSSSSNGHQQHTSSDDLGPDAVYGLLSWSRPADNAHGTLRLLQLMLGCMAQLQPHSPSAQEATQHVLAATSSKHVPHAVDLLLSSLPYAEHCMLSFCASKGHLHMVQLLLPRCTAPVRLHGVLHYVKASSFLAAAAGGHVAVLSELLAAGAARWACQLPGSSLTSNALDLAALGGHMQAMQLLAHYVANPSPYFLTAAADSGNGPAMEWALQHWFGQFNAVTAFSRAHLLQMHDALKVSCNKGCVSAVRQLLAALHRINNEDCCVLALTYASSSSNTDAIQAVLDSPQVTAQLARGGPSLLGKVAQACSSCIRIAIVKHCRPALDLLLRSLTSNSSPVAAARPLLAPHMRFIFDTAAQAGNAVALQLLLLMLPEHYEALGVSALEAALSEGHAEVAATIKTLLIMQGPDQAAAAAALSPEGNPGLAVASLHGAFKSACVRGDTAALQHLLQQGPEGPDDNMQLLMLRLAAGAGREEAVRLLLAEFGDAGPRLEANLKAVCRGGIPAGQLELLQSLASDRPRSALLSHITSQPEALAEYLRAALLCGQVDVAAWLVLLAHSKADLELVVSTLSSLLSTSRWELLNAGKGMSAHDVVVDLLKRLAALSSNSSSSSSRSARSSDSSTSSRMSEPGSPASAAHEAGGGVSSSATSSATNTDTSTAASSQAAGAESDTLTTVVSSGITAEQLASLGRELMQPGLLGQLLAVSQDNPWRLLAVLQVLDWWGLGSTQQQHRLAVAPTAAEAAATAVAADAAAPRSAADAVSVDSALQQQQQQLEPSGGHGAAATAAAARCAEVDVPRSSSGATSISSDDSASDSSSSSVTSSSSSGDATCGVVSPRGVGHGAAGPASVSPATAKLLTANSLDVGSLQSDDGQQQAQNWLDDLVTKARTSNSSSGSSAAGTTASGTTASGAAGSQQHQADSPTAQQQLDLRKEWGGSWQQLTGQVAQLNMTPSPQQQQAARRPRQSCDYDQQVAMQLRRRPQVLQAAAALAVRRESSPGRRSTAAASAAAKQLRATLSQQFTSQAPRCPVHPYMQQVAAQQQPQQQVVEHQHLQ